MAAPDVSLLEPSYKLQYEQLLNMGLNEQDAFDSVYRNQQLEIDARGQEVFEKEQKEAFEKKDFTALDPIVQEALGIIQPDYTKPFAERFLPGFQPEVVPAEAIESLPPATKTMPFKAATQRQQVQELQDKALVELERYYQTQGYPTFVETQAENLRKFTAQYGDKEDYVRNQSQQGVAPDEAGYVYDQLLEYVLNPPVGMKGAAETKARQTMFGATEDPSSFGPIDTPIQPRRYSQYGEMEKVGPRMDRVMQGASPLAEEIKRDPSIARDMSLGDLFDEATRPQVLVTGEQARQQREEQRTKQMDIEGSIRLIKKDTGLTETQAMAQLVKEFEDQARKQFQKQRKSFEPNNVSIKSGAAKFSPEELRRRTDIRIEDAVQQAVIAKFREAGMYDDLVERVPEYQGVMIAKIPDYTMEVLESITMDPTGNDAIQALKRQGRIDKDAIVEATPMQYARNINMAFRAIINPIMDIVFDEGGADITGVLPDQRMGVEEVEFYDKYGGHASPTYDFTEEADGIGNTFDAYLREVLVETATGRTLGNDIVSYHPEVFYSAAQEDLGEEGQKSSYMYSPSSYVLAGTLFEMGLPVEAPLVLGAKAIKAGSKVPANIKAYGAVAKELEKTPELATIAQAGDKIPFVERAIASNAKVSAHISDDAADTVLALERIEDLGINDGPLLPEEIELLGQGLNPKGKAVIKHVGTATDTPSTQAAKVIDDLALDDGRPILQAAATNSKETRFIGTSRTSGAPSKRADKVKRAMNRKRQDKARDYIDPVFTMERQAALKGEAFNVAEGQFGLGDYYMVTPRLAISKEAKEMGVVDSAMNEIDRAIGPIKPGFGNRTIRKEPFVLDEGAIFLESFVEDGVQKQIRVNYRRLLNVERAQDVRLDRIMDDVASGRAISFEDDVYLRQKLLENHIITSRLIRQKGASEGGLAIEAGFGDRPMIADLTKATRVNPESQFAKATRVPETRRIEVLRAADRIYETVTPKVIKDGIKKVGESFGEALFGAPTSALQDEAIEAVVSLQRQAPIAMGRLAANRVKDNPVDDAFAYAFNGNDFTTVNRAQGNTDAIKRATETLHQRMETSLSRMPLEDIVRDERVLTYYDRLLGPSFRLPENQAAFKEAMATVIGQDGFMKENLFAPSTQLLLMEEMVKLNPSALKTAAVRGRPKTAASIKPTDVDINGAKIAYSVDAARIKRLDNLGSQINNYMDVKVSLDTQYYREVLRIDKKTAEDLLDLETARYLQGNTRGGKAELESGWLRITGRPYEDPTGKGRGIRAFMTEEFGAPASKKAQYIRGLKNKEIAKGVDPLVAEAKVMNDVIPVLLSDEYFDAMRVMAPEAMDGIKLGVNELGLQQQIATNLVTMRRASPNSYRYMMDMFDYVVAPRKRLVAGQLGGLLLPNSIYHAENFFTAPLIASVTDPSYVSVIVEQQARAMGLAMADTAVRSSGRAIRFNPSVAKDVEIGAEGLARFVRYRNTGNPDLMPLPYIGNYSIDEAIELYRTKNLGSTETSLQFGDNFIRDVEDMAMGYGEAIAAYAKRGTIAPGAGTPYGMKLADQTDRMFREAVFFEALSRGMTGDEAARMAREVLLDYGSMPLAAKETIGKYFLYMSFTYTMGAEVTGALLRPKNLGSITKQLNLHRQMSQQMFGSQTELREDLWFNEIDAIYETDAKAYEVYLRNPMISSFSQVAGIMEYMRKPGFISRSEMTTAAQESQVMKAGLGIDALNLGYNPILSLMSDLNMEYKKPVPDKFVYQLSALPTEGILNSPQVIEFFDIEYVPVEERRPGKAEVGVDRRYIDMSTGQIDHTMTPEELEQYGRGGYQMRFKSEKGYQRFIAYQQMLQFAGYGRLLNDLTGAYIAAGQLPEGTSFGYAEKGNPVLYLGGRQKVVRVPKEWEKLDRQMRMYERDFQEFMGQFEQ